MKDFIKKIVKHYELHRVKYKTYNEDEIANSIYSSFAPEFKNLCLPDVSITKRKVGCKYTPTCMIRKQNQGCKPTRKCYEQPT
jgi:hypothetical protein